MCPLPPPSLAHPRTDEAMAAHVERQRVAERALASLEAKAPAVASSGVVHNTMLPPSYAKGGWYEGGGPAAAVHDDNIEPDADDGHPQHLRQDAPLNRRATG